MMWQGQLACLLVWPTRISIVMDLPSELNQKFLPSSCLSLRWCAPTQRHLILLTQPVRLNEGYLSAVQIVFQIIDVNLEDNMRLLQQYYVHQGTSYNFEILGGVQCYLNACVNSALQTCEHMLYEADTCSTLGDAHHACRERGTEYVGSLWCWVSWRSEVRTVSFGQRQTT